MLRTLFRIKAIFLCALMIALFSPRVFAEIRYIDDTLRIPLRTGAGTEYKITNFLISGTKVDQQRLDENNPDWAYVTVGEDKEGWVQVRYLRNTPAAKELLAYSQKELSKYKSQNKEQADNIKTLNSEIKDLKKQLDELSTHSQKSDKELEHIKEISKNAIRLDHNNSELLEENVLLKATQEENEQRIIKLESKQQNQGMIYGALAVLLGVILGWIMPKMRTRRNDGWV